MALVLSPQLKTALGLCLSIRGMVGGVHFRRGLAGRHIVYRERIRTSALSEKQLAHRVKFLRAYEQWYTLTLEEQADWGLAADRFSTRQIASHLFLRIWWRKDTWFLAQAKRWLGITLALPGP